MDLGETSMYMVTLVDYFSKWPEAAPLKDKTPLGVALYLNDLFWRYMYSLWS